MDELYACRLCLATDTKLFNIHYVDMAENVKDILGYSISTSDGLPQHICYICKHIICKYILFINKCKLSQEVLNYTLQQCEMLTTTLVQSINHNLPPSCNKTTPTVLDIIPTTKTKMKKDYPTKMEIEPDFSSIFSDDDDDTPLSTIELPRKPKIEFKEKNRTKTERLSITEAKHSTKPIKEENIFDTDFYIEGPLSKIKTSEPVKRKSGRKSFDEPFADVIILSKEEQLNEVKLRQNSLNYQNNPYKCNLCYKGFLEESAFNNHMVRHSESSGAFECDICHVRCPTKTKLGSHSVAAHERKYSCKQCRHISNTSHQAKEHEKWHQGHVYICKFCGEKYKKSTTLLTHVRVHHPEHHCVCTVCGESFLGPHGLATHKKKMHRGDEDESSISWNPHCKECNIQFKSVEALTKHKTTSAHNNQNDFSKPCRQCGDNFDSDDALLEHLKTHRDEIVQCEQCDAQFSSPRRCFAHYRRMHLGIKYSPRKNIVCEICGKKCTSNATLVCHQRTHSGEKPYQCGVCPKTFSVRQRLQIHSRTHTGERPYNCEHCPKAFRHKPALNRHMRVHSGAKPYTCTYCGKSFSQSNSMKLHIHTVHLKLPPPYRNTNKHKLE